MARNFFIGYEQVVPPRRYIIIEELMKHLDDEYQLDASSVPKIVKALERKEIKQTANQIKTEARVLYWLADLLIDPGLGSEYEKIVLDSEEGRSYAEKALKLYWRLAEAGFTWGHSVTEEYLRSQVEQMRMDLRVREADVERLLAELRRHDEAAAAEAGLVLRRSWEKQRELYQLPLEAAAFGQCRRVEYVSEFRVRFCNLSHSARDHISTQLRLLTERGRKMTKPQMRHNRYGGNLRVRAFGDLWVAEVSEQYRVLWSREGNERDGFVLTFHFVGTQEETQ